jgi:hypothetical protein
MNHTDARRAEVARLCDRLKRLYSERAVLPSAAHDFDDTEERETMSLNLLQRLFRAIISEGYGE